MKISFIVINNPALASDRKRTGQIGWHDTIPFDSDWRKYEARSMYLDYNFYAINSGDTGSW